MHIIHGELRKAPFIKTGCGQDGQSTMFIVELSEMIKDRQTGEKTYTNYSAAIFAKTAAQIGYYNTSLVEGNFIVVNCEKLKVDVNESNGKQYIKLQMEGARLEGAKYIENNQQAAPQGQGGYSQPAPQQQYDPKPNNGQGGFTNQAPQPQGQGFQQQAPQQQQQAPQGGFQQAPQQSQARQQTNQAVQQNVNTNGPIDFDDSIPF
tara:strand:- start:69 stop:686 length:618 start_codon:yes stop_codon:yes gene_type:complete